MPVRVAIALGSNLGDRQRHVAAAIERLNTLLDNVRVSTIVETDAVGVPGPQPAFLNAAAVGDTDRSARDLLRALQSVESDHGRERPFAGAPRTLDLDLILFGDSIIHEPDLVIPHPRFRDRNFVLEPLAEIAGEMLDPVTGLSVRKLLALHVGRVFRPGLRTV